MPEAWDQQQGILYQKNQVEDSYSIEGGQFCLPVAEEPPTDTQELLEWSPVAVVTAHAPYRIRTSKFQYKKTGNPPVIPKPASVGKFNFLAGEIHFPSPDLNSSLKNYDWLVGGQYVFVETCSSDPDYGFVLTTPPFVSEPQFAALTTAPPPSSISSNYGAARTAGLDARSGAYQSSVLASLGLNGAVYDYTSIGFFPGSFLNASIINGDTITTLPADIPPNTDNSVDINPKPPVSNL